MSMLRSAAAAAALLCLIPSVYAAEPASGTLTPTSGPITYASGPFTSANATPVPLVDTGPTCDSPAPECDSFTLTISLPSGYAAAHNGDFVRVTTAWTDTGAGASDYDLYVYSGDVGATSGGDTPNFSSASSSNPEITSIVPLSDGDNVYTIKIVPFTPSGETLTTTIELVAGESISYDPNFGRLPTPTVPGLPRYQNFTPNGVSAEASNGECNIGFDVNTSKIMFMCFGDGSVYRLTTPENLAEPLPKSCLAQWEDVTPLATSGPQPVADPIMFTDRVSGRTWASNLTAGPNASYAFTDDDGDNWVDAGAGGVAGADHQTIGSGPYPADFLLPHPLHENAVYFCSQALAGPAGCVRSDDGGVTYGVTTLPYDGTVCGGLHGHVRVAPDGTVWLPVATCGAGTGYSVSTDAGVTWADAMVPNTTSGSGSDPSIALDDDNTAYFCYINGDGHARVAVSRDRGTSWTDDTDLGQAVGVVNAAFPEAWGGSSGRAACGFIGTDRTGNIESLDFPGLWYLFMAHTYDGGKTWTTVNATPNHPVQGIGGVWMSGGSNPNRNLLDFNEVTEDNAGNVLFGYDDGCIGACDQAPLDNPQSFTALMTVARQTGGNSLRAANDQVEPHKPDNACLSGTRTTTEAALTWLPPDNGGAAISNYKVYRTTIENGPGVYIGDAGPKLSYVDRTVDPSIEKYYYMVTAVNASGEGVASNRAALPIEASALETPCVLPGLTMLSSAPGVTGNGGLPTKQDDLLQAWMAEPADMLGKLVFTIKVDNLTAVPPGYRWVMYFTVPGDDNRYFVAMDSSNGAPEYNFGTWGAIDTPAISVGAGTVLGTLDGTSTYDADGTIQLVLDRAAFGDATGTPINVGTELKDISASVRQSTSSGGTASGLTVDSANAAYPYLVTGNVCPGNGGTVVPGRTPDAGRFGGALGWLTLFPLLGMAALRRRWR